MRVNRPLYVLTTCRDDPGCDCLKIPKDATVDQICAVLTRRGVEALRREGVALVEYRQVEAGVRAAVASYAKGAYIADVIRYLAGDDCPRNDPPLEPRDA